MSKYYKVLGLKQDADINTIKTTYKRLMKEFHPDKTSHLSPVERNKSEIRAKEINEAYNKIKKEKGF
jgi:DnaJ like chaperone protein